MSAETILIENGIAMVWPAALAKLGPISVEIEKLRSSGKDKLWESCGGLLPIILSSEVGNDLPEEIRGITQALRRRYALAMQRQQELMNNHAALRINQDVLLRLHELVENDSAESFSYIESFIRDLATTMKTEDLAASVNYLNKHRDKTISPALKAQCFVTALNRALHHEQLFIAEHDAFISAANIQKVYLRSFGVTKIDRRISWLLQSDDAEVEVPLLFIRHLSPRGSIPRTAGSWNANSLVGIIDLDTIEMGVLESETLPEKLDADWQIEALSRKRRTMEETAALSQYCDGNLAESYAQTTACEEMKHGINSGWQLLSDDEGKETPRFDRRMRFTNSRLRDETELKEHWDHASSTFSPKSEKSRSIVSQSMSDIEECNAKLFVLAVGPSPQIALTEIVVLFELDQEDNALNKLILQGLCSTKHGDESTPRTRDELLDFGQRLLQEQPQTIRLLAWNTIQRLFKEDMRNSPFCIVDKNGELKRTRKTHPYFAEWAKKQESSFLSRLPEFIQSFLRKLRIVGH